MPPRILRFATLGVALAVPAAAWGPEGHRVVADLAAARLTPAARAGVRALLGARSLADVSTWADDVRASRPDTAPWHFVDIPIARDTYRPSVDCRHGDCSIAALAREQRLLADPSTPRPVRVEALEFVVHLVADVHQPLHSADNSDRGGNEEDVRFVGRPMRLHAVWDSGIIERTGLDDAAYVRRLERRLATEDAAAIARGSPTDWALEAHAQAKRRAYRDPDGALIVDGERLTRRYESLCEPVVDEQLARAGVRLARLLNEAFPR